MIKMQLVSHDRERIGKNQDKRDWVQSADEWIRGGAGGTCRTGTLKREARQRRREVGETKRLDGCKAGKRPSPRFEFWQLFGRNPHAGVSAGRSFPFGGARRPLSSQDFPAGSGIWLWLITGARKVQSAPCSGRIPLLVQMVSLQPPREPERFILYFFIFLRLTDLAFPGSTRCDPAQERLFISPAIVHFTPGNHGDID